VRFLLLKHQLISNLIRFLLRAVNATEEETNDDPTE
jgi:hypothetical protein